MRFQVVRAYKSNKRAPSSLDTFERGLILLLEKFLVHTLLIPALSSIATAWSTLVGDLKLSSTLSSQELSAPRARDEHVGGSGLPTIRRGVVRKHSNVAVDGTNVPLYCSKQYLVLSRRPRRSPWLRHAVSLADLIQAKRKTP